MCTAVPTGRFGDCAGLRRGGGRGHGRRAAFLEFPKKFQKTPKKSKKIPKKFQKKFQKQKRHLTLRSSWGHMVYACLATAWPRWGLPCCRRSNPSMPSSPQPARMRPCAPMYCSASMGRRARRGVLCDRCVVAVTKLIICITWAPSSSSLSARAAKMTGPWRASEATTASRAAAISLAGGLMLMWRPWASRYWRPTCTASLYLPEELYSIARRRKAWYRSFVVCAFCSMTWGEGGVGREEASEARPRRRLGRRLEEVAEAVGGGCCRLQTPLHAALGVRETVAGRRLGALGGEGLPPPPSNASLPGVAQDNDENS